MVSVFVNIWPPQPNSLFEQDSSHPGFLVVPIIETKLFPCLLLETTRLCRFPDKEQRELLSSCGIASKEYGDSKLVLFLSADLVCRHSSVRGVKGVDIGLITIEPVLWFVTCIDFLQLHLFAYDILRISRCCLPMLPIFL